MGYRPPGPDPGPVAGLLAAVGVLLVSGALLGVGWWLGSSSARERAAEACAELRLHERDLYLASWFEGQCPQGDPWWWAPEAAPALLPPPQAAGPPAAPAQLEALTELAGPLAVPELPGPCSTPLRGLPGRP